MHQVVGYKGSPLSCLVGNQCLRDSCPVLSVCTHSLHEIQYMMGGCHQRAASPPIQETNLQNKNKTEPMFICSFNTHKAKGDYSRPRHKTTLRAHTHSHHSSLLSSNKVRAAGFASNNSENDVLITGPSALKRACGRQIIHNRVGGKYIHRILTLSQLPSLRKRHSKAVAL